ncbi:MAG: class I SAM-dependent methyltransferase [Candidatus Levybacteria bacterium]|nr:class I SAM-dependent methyltransferase [Candidatus Levybacteria bacterium]
MKSLEERIYSHRFTNHEERRKMWATLTKHFFQKFFSPGDTVLDLGCGNCEFINTLVARRKIGVDSNPEVERFASKNVEIIISHSANLRVKKQSIDKVFISNVFEHLDRKAILETIIELHRVLKKGAKVLILQPNIRFCSKDYWRFFDHVTPIDDRALEEIFIAYGFTLDYRIVKFLPFTTKSVLPKSSFLIKIYLQYPLLWKFFGQQSFLIFKK